jgi:hypothetical protein
VCLSACLSVCLSVSDLVLAADSFLELLRNLSLESLKKFFQQGEFWENRLLESRTSFKDIPGLLSVFSEVHEGVGRILYIMALKPCQFLENLPLFKGPNYILRVLYIFSSSFGKHMYRLCPQKCVKWFLRSSGMLRSVNWTSVHDA